MIRKRIKFVMIPHSGMFAPQTFFCLSFFCLRFCSSQFNIVKFIELK